MTQANRYMKLAALTKRMDTLDSSYHAAFYLLSYDPKLLETASRYITVDGINFISLKRAVRGFDERTRQVVDIAHNLFSWSNKCTISPFDISRLGYPYIELVCKSLYIAAGEVQVILEQGQDGQTIINLDDSRYQRNQRIYQQLEQLQKAVTADMEKNKESSRSENEKWER
ncbi:MAG: hypothetical protein PHE09_02485 [Oscillospiraceae bacterium]|nr:hypothetical protein [Oscillospiraceae bacterium]